MIVDALVEVVTLNFDLLDRKLAAGYEDSFSRESRYLGCHRLFAVVSPARWRTHMVIVEQVHIEKNSSYKLQSGCDSEDRNRAWHW